VFKARTAERSICEAILRCQFPVSRTDSQVGYKYAACV